MIAGAGTANGERAFYVTDDERCLRIGISRRVPPVGRQKFSSCFARLSTNLRVNKGMIRRKCTFYQMCHFIALIINCEINKFFCTRELYMHLRI